MRQSQGLALLEREGIKNTPRKIKHFFDNDVPLEASPVPVLGMKLWNEYPSHFGYFPKLTQQEQSCQRKTCLTHYRPAMPFGNRNNYFIGLFQFSIVTIKKNIIPLET